MKQEARAKAEAAVVRAAKRLHRIGNEHADFWHVYYQLGRAVERLDILEAKR
jgi:hypothetical protein